MRSLLFLALLATPAVADSYKIVEDTASVDLDHSLIAKADLEPCFKPGPAEGSALFWIEVAGGKVKLAEVHGAGKLDACLAKALAKAKPADKTSAVVLGHIDVMEAQSSKLQPSPRLSTTPVVIDRHNTKWQLTIDKLSYTANRAADIAAALDGASTAISDCAEKRSKPGKLVAWITAGGTIARSGTAAYDNCLMVVLSSIKLPAPESALWLQITIAEPAEALAPRVDNPRLSHEQALHDALNTAVRARRLDMLECLDGHKGLTLTKVTVTLRAEKANVKTVDSGDAAVDKCVRGKLVDVKVPSAKPADTLDLDVELN